MVLSVKKYVLLWSHRPKAILIRDMMCDRLNSKVSAVVKYRVACRFVSQELGVRRISNGWDCPQVGDWTGTWVLGRGGGALPNWHVDLGPQGRVRV